MYRVRFNTNLCYSELLFIMYLSFDVYILPLQIFNFGVLLTVHLNIFILVINQLDALNLFYNKFILCLYIFRAPCAHRQEVKIIFYSIWIPEAVKYNFDLLTMSTWCSKHVEA